MRTILVSLVLMFTACIETEQPVPTDQAEPGITDPVIAAEADPGPKQLKVGDPTVIAQDADPGPKQLNVGNPTVIAQDADPGPKQLQVGAQHEIEQLDPDHARVDELAPREPQRCEALDDCGPAEFCQLTLHVCVVEPK